MARTPPTLDETVKSMGLSLDPGFLPPSDLERQLEVPSEGLPLKCPSCGTEQTYHPALDGMEAPIVFRGSPAKRQGDWWVGRCKSPLCGQPILVMGRGAMIFPRIWLDPPDENIPKNVRRDYEEALLCRAYHLPQAAAVMARRTIQTAAIEKGAPKDGNLHSQISHLEKEGIVTVDLRESLDVIRNYGNDGAHTTQRRVTTNDAKEILDAVNDVLRFLFVTPARNKKMRENRKPASHEK